jgi:hypothetical protein
MDTEIRTIALELPVGESERFLCPYCLGGSSQEKSLVVSRTQEGLKYMCHRASCGLPAGFEGSRQGVDRPQWPQKNTHFYTDPLRHLSHEESVILNKKYQISASTISHMYWRYAPKHNSLAMPCFDVFRNRIAVQLKHFPGMKQILPSKNKIYRELMTDVYCLYQEITENHLSPKAGAVVVVEDQISAAKIWQLGYNACALLGTHMSDQVAQHLSSRHRTILLALDKDTWVQEKYLKIYHKHGILFDNFKALYMHKDPKDTDKDVLQDIVVQSLGEYI